MHKYGWVLGSLAIVAISVHGRADEASPRGGAQPAAFTAATMIRVTGFRRSAVPAVGYAATAPSSAGSPPYTGGPYYVAIDLENAGPKTAEGIVVKLGVRGTTMESTITIPAKSTAQAIFTDTVGITSACAPTPYTISLSGTGANPAVRHARVTPSCTFTSSVDEDWNHKSPDHVEAMQKNNVYLIGASLLTPPTCNGGPKIKVHIVNQYSGSSPSLVAQAKVSAVNGAVKAQTAAAFPLGPKESKDLVLTPVANATSDVAPKLKLDLVDWTKSLGGHVVDGGIVVTTARSCTLAFALVD